MSTFTASNLDEPPPKKINQQPMSWSPSSSFSSLPNDIVLDILARVPKRYYPILSCVSKNFQILVRSPEIHKTRSLYNKDSLYIRFIHKSDLHNCNWFTLRMNENLFVPIDFSFIPNLDFSSSVIAVGPEIFFFLDCKSKLWIFDSQSGKHRQGPSMQVEMVSKTLGLVGNKIYVIGWDNRRKIHAQFFDLSTQTWNTTTIPEEEEKHSNLWMYLQNNVVLDKKVCWLTSRGIECYDTRDGSCESFEYANNEEWCKKRVCVIDNVLYVYYYELGLMWYDSKVKEWRKVNGLDHLLINVVSSPVGMVEYYGKLAYMWIESDGETEQIWCRMIDLDRNEVRIHGIAEPSQILGIVPCGYSSQKCLSVSS